MKILICGRNGAGKTTLARALAPLIGATVFDGDDIRATYPRTVGFSPEARVYHAMHMRTLCEAVTAAGNHAIASFICPTDDTRAAFKADFTVWADAAPTGQYPDSDKLWLPPAMYDMRTHHGHEPYHWAELLAGMIQPIFNPMRKTALLVGRFEPFHEGHRALALEAIARHGQVCFGVRDHSREYPFHFVKARIDAAMQDQRGRYTVLPLPNIAAICYGRDVGYAVEQIDLPPDIQAISATERRITGGLPRA